MDPNGEIIDAFDDDRLRRAIEQADEGPWRDEQAKFVDPKLKSIERQLAAPPTRTYRERRLDELRKHGVRPPAAQPPPKARPQTRKPSASGPSPAADAGWGEPNEFHAAEPPAGTAPADPSAMAAIDFAEPPSESITASISLRPMRPPPTAISPRTGMQLAIGYAAAGATGVFVFALAAAIVVPFVGWHPQLVWRAAAAGTATGLLWRYLAVDRLRAIPIATASHLLAFLGAANLQDLTELFGVFLGLLIAVAGSVLFGAFDEELGAGASGAQDASTTN